MNKHEIADVLKQFDKIPLPEKEKILTSCPNPTESGNMVSSNTYRHKLRGKVLIAACTAIIMLVSGFSAYAISVEVKEYKDAVTFFNEHDLSADGLSRGEMKKVYRDIKTGSFTFGRTVDVIQQSIINSSVGGYEIFQDDPTPEDLENLWKYKTSNGRYLIENSGKDYDGVSYKYYSIEKYQKDLGFDVHEKSVFEKYKDKSLIWSAEFVGFWIENYIVSDGKVILYGRSPRYSSAQKSYAWMALIDNDGTILWKTKLDNGFNYEYIGAILSQDKKVVVFSRGDLKYLCLSEYDLNGNLVSFHKTEVGNYGIWNAARLGDGYIIQLGSYNTDEYARIVKVNSKGIITDSFTYDSDDSYYFIKDMIEYNGNIYLSGYSVPLLGAGESNAGGRYDIAAVLNYIFDNKMYDISNDELTKLVRDNFTAVLLVCDLSSGIPKEFYSVIGSLGGKLALSDSKKLIWDVESITDTFFSLMTSAFTIGGSSYVYRYTFDENGIILNQEKTAEIAKFYR